MVCLSIETEAGGAVALGRVFERYGCRVLDCGSDHLRVGFPEAASEREAAAEARLYLSLRPASTGGASRPNASISA
jgi:hypothetical protein